MTRVLPLLLICLIFVPGNVNASDAFREESTKDQTLCRNVAQHLHMNEKDLRDLKIVGRERISEEHEAVLFHRYGNDVFPLFIVDIATRRPILLVDQLPSHSRHDYLYHIVSATKDSLRIEGVDTSYGSSKARRRYFFDLASKKSTGYDEMPPSLSYILSQKGYVYFAGSNGEHGIIVKLPDDKWVQSSDVKITTTMAGKPMESIRGVRLTDNGLTLLSENYVYEVNQAQERVSRNPSGQKYERPPENYVGGEPYGREGLFVRSPSKINFYPLPQPRMEGENAEGLTYQNNVGPIQPMGDKIWFGLTFYDGEGYSGVGGIGTFDLKTQSYEVTYIPALKDFSASAILVEGDEVWLGLYEQPEAEPYGAGIAQYDVKSKSVKKYDVPGIANRIEKYESNIYIATSEGFSIIDSEGMVNFGYLERTRDGQYQARMEKR